MQTLAQGQVSGQLEAGVLAHLRCCCALARPAPRAGAFRKARPCGANPCQPCSRHGAQAGAAPVWKAPPRGSAVGEVRLALGSACLAWARLKSGFQKDQGCWAASCTVLIDWRTGDVEAPLVTHPNCLSNGLRLCMQGVCLHRGDDFRGTIVYRDNYWITCRIDWNGC